MLQLGLKVKVYHQSMSTVTKKELLEILSIEWFFTCPPSPPATTEAYLFSVLWSEQLTHKMWMIQKCQWSQKDFNRICSQAAILLGIIDLYFGASLYILATLL